MECKVLIRENGIDASLSIDLTRMECKESNQSRQYHLNDSIDLTRMECKVLTASLKEIFYKYRFNQNGMYSSKGDEYKHLHTDIDLTKIECKGLYGHTYGMATTV